MTMRTFTNSKKIYTTWNRTLLPKKWISILCPITIPRVFHRWLDPDEAPYPPVRYLCELSFLPYHHFVDWAKSTVVLPPKHVLHDVMTSHPGYEWRHRDQRWPWHRPRTDASGLLGDVTKPPTSHPGSLADSTVTTVDLAAGQDVRHRLRRPTM